ncbi:MAG: hypothetical protein ABI151_11040 [Chitinophagaceae bacterium]
MQFSRYPSNEQEVIQFERDFAKALLAGDSTTIDSYIERDYTGSYNSFPENKQDVMSVTPSSGATVKDLEMKVNVFGTSAIATGIWELKQKNSKPTYSKFTDMLVKRKEGWKVVGSIQNAVPFWSVREALDSELVTVPAQPCETESSLKSQTAGSRTYLRIKNQTTDTLTIYWINYEGKRDPGADEIRKAAPGKDVVERTFVTHPFVVTGSSGKCYGIYTAVPQAGIVVIK